jgi:hypothetical protein
MSLFITEIFFRPIFLNVSVRTVNFDCLFVWTAFQTPFFQLVGRENGQSFALANDSPPSVTA